MYKGQGYENRDFRLTSCFISTNRFISETIQDMAIVTVEDEYKLVCDLSNGATFNEPE